MQIVLFEDHGWRDLLPLTTARATFELRSGCNMLMDKVAGLSATRPLACVVRPHIEPVVRERYAWATSAKGTQLWLNGRLLCRTLHDLPCPGVCWVDDTLVAAHVPAEIGTKITPEQLLAAPDPKGMLRTLTAGFTHVPFAESWGRLIRYPWDLIAENGAELHRQIDAMPPIHEGRVDEGVHLLNFGEIRIHSCTRVKPTAVLDAEDGPIHIGKNVTISPHVCVRGPCSIGDGCIIQPGASIRENTSLGPVCKIGGEVEGTIVQGYSNKQHDGFLGHSYVGEWVNLGADTVTSDLKNTYGNISVIMPGGATLDTGQRFIGSIIGDHTKTAICTRLNTGTVLGFCTMIATGRPPRAVPDFTWLTDDGAKRYDVEKALATARTVMGRRKITMTPAYEAMFRMARHT